MKTFFLHLSLIFVLILVATLASGQGYIWESLTPDNAIQTVRDFEGDSNLAVTLAGVDDNDPGMADMFAETYLYKLSTDRYDYTVSKYSHTRFTRQDRLFSYDKAQFYGQPYDPNILKQQAMTQEAAVAIADGFMQTHYPAPQLLTRGQAVPRYPDEVETPDPQFIEAYAVPYYQDCGGGVKGPSYCFVDVDSVRGQIIGYYQAYYPVLVPTLPGLTGEQAMVAAMNTVLGSPGTPGEVESLYVIRPDALGVEHLVYQVSFDGVRPGNMQSATYVAEVDAFNGSVLTWDIRTKLNTMPNPPRPSPLTLHPTRLIRYNMALRKPLLMTLADRATTLSYPPLLVDNRPYLYLGYLCYGAPDARLAYKSRDHIAVVSRTRRMIFSLNSRTFRLNGQDRKMTTKPIIIGNRCYVPLEAAQAVLPFRIRYEARAGRVRFDPKVSVRK